MSGHSKWHNIQAKKGKADAAKGRIFTKLGREIAVAAKSNPNPETNSKLADIIAKAKAANMPNDNIMRSIKKASGEMSGADYKELTYEGYGVAGSAVIITTLTDNINRTAGDVRAILSKHGGQLGQNGCVSYNFDNKGYIVIERTVDLDEDTITELALEAGADDVVVSDDVYEIFTRSILGRSQILGRKEQGNDGGSAQDEKKRGRRTQDYFRASGSGDDSPKQNHLARRQDCYV